MNISLRKFLEVALVHGSFAPTLHGAFAHEQLEQTGIGFFIQGALSSQQGMCRKWANAYSAAIA